MYVCIPKLKSSHQHLMNLNQFKPIEAKIVVKINNFLSKIPKNRIEQLFNSLFFRFFTWPKLSEGRGKKWVWLASPSVTLPERTWRSDFRRLRLRFRFVAGHCLIVGRSENTVDGWVEVARLCTCRELASPKSQCSESFFVVFVLKIDEK